jgi:hypothetical protein
MPTDSTNQQIEVMFNGLQRGSAAHAIPAPGTLSAKLARLVDTASGETSRIDAATLALFATASVEMWHRSIHSFLVSASLTKASPLWASVSGYYSSHYSIRAFAHLLGYFQLQSKKRILYVEVKGSQYICHIIKKDGGDREHKFYWKTVKNHTRFAADPLFTKNEEGQPRSDCGHRTRANYIDHINQFPKFQALDEAYLKQRVDKIAGIELLDAPIPRTESYPDTDNVQLIAYHRMVIYREFVDEALDKSNRFWKVHRKPSWCPPFLDFQVVQPQYTRVYGEQLK